ncbi:NADP-dependent malic enzyme [Butyricimonas virosa]|uniref:NADP-dependent malic enzyme n=2 Tax=Butyricimonas virosa TaxID=544645 RepID=A0A413IKP3_9BACT|nr:MULTISPECIES: NADP-dependent malic enzyme [Butyricimonas]MCI7164069.1 NADP-dependent malic enzyme [Butyricimonas virosa]MCI7295438.1 NADP-dependent malic enzyme [Butyricimonas virosa]MDY5488297.1 NADP-dependent malic enzyme [Butyricimonas virosa]MDY5532362.1 NADP-dependent malic enzyme [Butyricimonas virosa]MDY6218365.1 NADP-dependent malic enzyme [Butyricimonas virosa]
MNNMDKKQALHYHAMGRPGKIEVVPTKPHSTQYDLSLAYSPGVAEPCLEIQKNQIDAYKYTAKSNLVAVISNGTAVLGLGDIGALSGKPVMEGKGLLFKIFADIDVFDIELDTKDVDKFIETVKMISPTFGGINLEDIKAPECFEIERRLKKELDIPVMHDDQHGTAIISAAGLLNALELNGKKIDTIRVVVNGAGAAAISCARLYKALGVKKENMIMCDSKGVIYTGRAGLNAEKEEFAVETSARTLTEALVGADMFLGLSVADILNEEMIQSMAKDPIVFALANPNPEISYEKAIHSRPDIIFATGRSDYPNQINNVLGFPYIFRGALDVQARSINEEMKLAATYALAELTKEPVPENVKMAYNDPSIAFGRNYIIPKPLDTRLISRIAPAVAKAAIESGVARTEIEDWDAYRDQLEKRMGQDERLMRRMTRKAKTNPKRIVFAEGADIKTLMAVQEILSEKIAHPILIGNKTEIETLQKQYKLELPELTIFDPTKEIDKIDQYTQAYYEKRQRKGIILEQAKELMKNPNFIGLMMVESGEADGFISGIHSNYHDVLRAAKDIIGLRACCKYAVGMHIVTNKKGTYFLADTTVNSHPSADTLECVTVLTYEAVKQFNVEPVVALTSYSNFGEYRLGSPAQIQEAVDTLHRKYPEILVDGEMSASIAFNTELRQARFPFSPLANKDVNTIIFPNLSSGSIALGILQELGNNEIIGPVLLGLNKPVHILQMGCSVRDIVYMTTLAVTDAQKEMPVDMCRI